MYDWPASLCLASFLSDSVLLHLCFPSISMEITDLEHYKHHPHESNKTDMWVDVAWWETEKGKREKGSFSAT